jgi:GAF domain-containing protein
MRRRKTGRKTGKIRRGKTLKSRSLSKATYHRVSARSAEDTKLAQVRRERDEAREQRAATAEVLRIISKSSGQLEPVFQTILENAVRICEAKFGVLYSYEKHTFHPTAEFGVPSSLSKFIQQRGAFKPRHKTLERLVQTKQVIYCADVLTEDKTNPMAEFGGARTYVAVPMVKETELVGTIIIYRQEVRPFTDEQIGLLTNFAA